MPLLADVAEAVSRHDSSAWSRHALSVIETDQCRSADTHLLRLDMPAFEGIDIYLKDESTHPTGSLKHRLARSLFLYGICNGRIREDTPIVEASSGSTAISEAYFARLLGLPFHAVMLSGTSGEKIEAIERYGGRCHLIEQGAGIYGEAQRLADALGGVYLDQFTFAERATDWRGNNNIAESIFEQMSRERHPVPAWIVMSAGTGGTTATIGRYIRYKRYKTRLCVPDPEHSVFYEAYSTGNMGATSASSSLIEGIGRPRVEPSFVPDVIDCMMKIPDAASLAAMRALSRRLGRKVGGSTGTNFFALLLVALRMREQGANGSLITMICDSGDRYLQTYYNDDWLAKKGLNLDHYECVFETILTQNFQTSSEVGSLKKTSQPAADLP
jgi:cysteine synthase A